jgi:hypothetical protein
MLPLPAIKKALKELSYKSVFVAQLFYWYNYLDFHISYWLAGLLNREKVLVYQVGKVGSGTIRDSLNSHGFHSYHVHFLTQEGIEQEKKWISEQWGYSRPRMLMNSIRVKEYQYLRDKISARNALEGKRWKVVTLVRDPIAIEISGFFNSLEGLFPNLVHRYQARVLGIDEIIESFLKEYVTNPAQIGDYTLNWFDREMKPVFGIDIYSDTFPKSKGFKIYNGAHADLLLLKLEKLNECAADAFQEFLDIEDFQLVNAHLASEKEYRDVYQDFMNTLVLPDVYIETLYTSKYAQHFYGEDEIAAFKEKWCKQKIAAV